jgi:hypothetical protein
MHYKEVKLLMDTLVTERLNYLKRAIRKVLTHYIVVSSLGVVPKTTLEAMKKMFKVQDRVEIQTINLVAKRTCLATIKRSHKIYSNTMKQNNKINNIYKTSIDPDDDSDDIQEKQLGALQNEISATDYAVVGNPNQNLDLMTNRNYDDLFEKPEYDTTDVLDKTTVTKLLLKDEDGVEFPEDQDPDQLPHDVDRLQTILSDFESDTDLLLENDELSLSNRIIQSREFPRSPLLLLNGKGPPQILLT